MLAMRRCGVWGVFGDLRCGALKCGGAQVCAEMPAP